VQVTLRFIAALAREMLELILGLDPFGDGGHVEGVRKPDDR
jgi:hypothetical protein